MTERGWQPPVIEDAPRTGPVDTPPKDDGQADEIGWDSVQLDPDAIEEGEQLGAEIDIHDDTDNGGIPVVVNGAVTPIGGDGPTSEAIDGMDPTVPTPGEDPMTVAPTMSEIDQELGDWDEDGRGRE